MTQKLTSLLGRLALGARRSKPGARRSAAALGVVALALSTAGPIAHEQGQLRRDQSAEPARGTAAIAGFVVDEATGAPVRRVEISLAGADQGGSRVTFTDDAGAFTFPNLPAGRYSLTATRPGWVRTAYGAKRYDRPGTPINLAAGQVLSNLRLSISKGAVITGQVLDQTGLPAVGVQVRVLEYRTVLGERRLARGTSTGGLLGEATDDQGVYRLYGLPPGDYVVVASPTMPANAEIRAMTDAEIRDALQAAQRPPQQQAAMVGATSTAVPPAERRDQGATVGFAPVFYPGTTTAAAATTITVGAGEERGGIDFQIQLVQTARIDGVVLPPSGVAPQSVSLMLIADEQLSVPGLIGPSLLNRVTPDAEGRFTYRSVAPGRYRLSARAVQGGPEGGRGNVERNDVTMAFQSAGGGAPVLISGGRSDQPAFWALSDITVAGQDVENIVLALEPAMTISGQIRFEGNATPPRDFGRVRLTMQPAPSAGPQISIGFPSVSVGHNGEFTAKNVTPGRYLMSGSVPTPPESFTPVNWRMKSAIVDGRDILDFPLEVGPYQNVANAVVTFTDVTQSVSGALQDASGRPAPDYTIVVFAADAAYWLPRARRIRTSRPGTDGRFSIEGLPAGSYRMAAVTDMADEDAFDPAFLEQLVPASFSFALAEGERKVQDMRLAGGG